MLRASYCFPADNLRAACDQVAGDLQIPMAKQKERALLTWTILIPTWMSNYIHYI